jgi:adenylosuccinate lyase
VFPAVIAAECARHLPFLATTTILMEAVKSGAGRETAHAAIKEHALAAAAAIRAGEEPRLVERLAADLETTWPALVVIGLYVAQRRRARLVQ